MKETRFKETEIGKVPVDWEVVPLENLFSIGNGYTPSKAEPMFWRLGTIPWFRMEDIRKNGRILKNSIQHITPLAVKGRGLYPAGSIIISTTATIGEHALLIADSLANQRFTFLWNVNRCYKADTMYLFYHCFLLGDWCRKNTNFGGLTAVNMPALKRYPFPLPPLSEQRRIAAALSGVDKLISCLDKKIEKKKLIKQGTMQQLLTGKVRLKGFDEPWVEVRLGDVAQIYRGSSPRPIEAYLTTAVNGVNWIKIGDVSPKAKFIEKTEEKITPFGVAQSRYVHAGDFLLSNSMSFGRPYILRIITVR